MPTQSQLDARLNPNPVTFNVATSGLFRNTNDFGSAIYYKDPTSGQVTNFSLIDAKNGLYTPGLVGSGNQASEALSTLKSKYGVDWYSLPQFNVADAGNSPSGAYAGDITSLLSKGFAGTTQTTVNGPGTVNPSSIVPQGTTPLAPGASPAVATPNLGANGQYNTSTGTALGTPLTPAQAQAPQYTLPSSINSGNTQTSGTNNYQQPANTSNSLNGDMAGLNATYAQQLAAAEKLGPQDQKESDLVKQIMALNTQDAGRAGAQTTANTTYGVDSAQATINSLTATQKQNLDAYNAAQLQDQQGQGVTTAVDQRQRDAVTKQYAIRALATSSLLAAAQGDLANAQLLANKAVAAIYDPIEAQIAAGKANLQLLASDPATTLEEKTQAAKVSAILNAQSAAVEKAKTNATEVQKVAVTAASYIKNFVPSTQYPTAAQALAAVQNASDPVAAQLIATNTGLTAPTVKTGEWTDLSGKVGGSYLLGTNYVQRNNVTGEIRTAVNPPNSSSASSSIPGGATLSTTDKQALLGVGFTASEIVHIQADVNAHGLQTVLAGVSDSAQRNALQKVYGTPNTTQFLTTTYLSNIFGDAALEKAASAAGYKTGGFLGFGESGDKTTYLTHLMSIVNQYRQAGYTDQDILKMLQ